MRKSRRRYQRGCLRESDSAFLLKYYDAVGVQRTKTLGPISGPGKITRTEAKRLQAEFMAKVNDRTSFDRRRFRNEATIAEFIEQVYAPARQDETVKSVRKNTFKSERQRLNAYVLPIIGEVVFADVTQDDLSRVLSAARERELGDEMLRKLRGDVIRVCKRARGEGCLDRPVWEGLGRATSVKPKAEKLTLDMESYVTIWTALQPRDRLAFGLVMFQGLRESEVFGLQCGDLIENGIAVRRSWFNFQLEFPKTQDSFRKIGFTGPLRTAFEDHIASLPAREATDWVFPSTTIVTPEDPGNAMKNRIKPVLRSLGYPWVSFAVLRRSCSSRNHGAKRDIDLISYQQGHDRATHIKEYVQFDLEALAEGPEQDYHEFVECLSKGAK